MISRTARHALRTLGFLVRHRGQRIRGEEIARVTGIPANYLSKILNQMRKQGIVNSEKGWGGGFELEARALDLPIQDVLKLFDGSEGIPADGCAFGMPSCSDEDPCPLHPYWERVRNTLSDMVTATSVRDLGGPPA